MADEQQPQNNEAEHYAQTTLDTIARQQANIRAPIGQSLADSAPGLVDKLVNPKVIPDSPYHGIIPNLNFGNYTDDPTGILGGLMAELLFTYMDAANQLWLDDRLAKKCAAAWTVDVEESKGRGNERMIKLFFGQSTELKIKTDKPNMFENKKQ